jgi:hypothetical protein
MSPLCEYHTPEGSEVDALDYANTVAAELFYLARIDRVKEHPYQRCATWLDTIPGAGEYFRCLSAEELSDEQLDMWLWRKAWYKEVLAQQLQTCEAWWMGKQWANQPRKDRRRVKNRVWR